MFLREGTAPTWNGDLNFSKWGPNWDLILSEMGTKWGPSAAEMGTRPADIMAVMAWPLPQVQRSLKIYQKWGEDRLEVWMIKAIVPNR